MTQVPLWAAGRTVGGCFVLNRPSPATVSEPLSNGWTIELLEASRELVVRGSSLTDTYEDALNESANRAQEALDLHVVRGGAVLLLEDPDVRHSIWWKESRGQILRVKRVNDIAISMSATATVKDSSGATVPPTPPPVLAWHPSLRYFRLAQATSDLFDAYRNMYLALESVLSHRLPQRTNPKTGKVNEREADWLIRALHEVDKSLPLGSYAPPGSADPVQAVFDELYTGTRTRVFHAKAGRPTLLPHSGADRAKVLESLDRLGRLYLGLADQFLSMRKPSGAVTYAGFDRMTQFPADIVVSDDPAEALRTDTDINPTGGTKISLTTRLAPEVSMPGLKYWLAEEPVTGTLAASPVSRVALATSDHGNLYTVDRLEAPLNLHGLDLFQVQLGLRLVNLQLPRAHFTN